MSSNAAAVSPEYHSEKVTPFRAHKILGHKI